LQFPGYSSNLTAGHLEATLSKLLAYTACSGQLSLLPSGGWEMSSSFQTQVPQIRPLADIVHFKYSFAYLLTYLLRWRSSLADWALVCLLAAPRVQMFANMDNGWPHRYRSEIVKCFWSRFV